MLSSPNVLITCFSFVEQLLCYNKFWMHNEATNVFISNANYLNMTHLNMTNVYEPERHKKMDFLMAASGLCRG